MALPVMINGNLAYGVKITPDRLLALTCQRPATNQDFTPH
jgi:hypothetical protein